MTKPKAINRKKLVAFVLLICKIKLPWQFTNRVCRYRHTRTGGDSSRCMWMVIAWIFLRRLRWSVLRKRRSCENQLASGLKQVVRQEYRGHSSLAGIQGCWVPVALVQHRPKRSEDRNIPVRVKGSSLAQSVAFRHLILPAHKWSRTAAELLRFPWQHSKRNGGKAFEVDTTQWSFR